jgi:hypothetical protein
VACRQAFSGVAVAAVRLGYSRRFLYIFGEVWAADSPPNHSLIAALSMANRLSSRALFEVLPHPGNVDPGEQGNYRESPSNDPEIREGGKQRIVSQFTATPNPLRREQRSRS